MSIGQRLKQAREERNITIEDVARRTNIRLRFLQSIDDDDLESIPSSHRRLFVREYAKVVGVAADEILVDLPEVSPAIVATEATEREAAPYRSSQAESDRVEYKEILNRLASSGGKIGSLTSNPAFMMIGAATILLLGIAVYYFVWGNDSTTSTSASTQIDTSAAQTEILSAPEVDTTTAATPAVDTESGDSLTLEGRASARVWFTIVMDGKRSETGTLDSGMVKTWRAFEVFKVSLGNAGGLQLLLNDKPIGTLGPASSVVRSKYIDKEGIRQGAGRRPTSVVAPTIAAPVQRRAISSRVASRRPSSRTARRSKRPAPMKEILTTQIR
ncbi:MAG: DUF4115 domain-containing protein [bacterium]|nr:DUF4115 domain-containing protein [Candidatus Kapabacteria bacterium]